LRNNVDYLFDHKQESAHNELVALFLVHSLYLFNKQGVFLDLTQHPNLYDEGNVSVCFIDESLIEIEDYDENNEIDKQSAKTIN
jgi:hypothetical protein